MTFQDKQYLVQQPFVLIIIDILHKVGQFTVKLSYASIQWFEMLYIVTCIW